MTSGWSIPKEEPKINITVSRSIEKSTHKEAVVFFLGVLFVGGVLLGAGIFIGRWLVLSNLNILN